MDNDIRTERAIRLLRLLLSQQYNYKRKELADYFGVSESSIKRDIKLFKSIGLHVEIKKYRYAIIPEKEFKELSYLQRLTDTERATISRLLHREKSKKEAEAINLKLANLYNFQQLGLRALRRPSLDRIDTLQLAKKQGKQVILENYRSNSSNQVRNRYVEAFNINTELDTVQAVDLEVLDKIENEYDAIKHFRISRIDRVIMTDKNWKYKKLHFAKATDVFRIANEEQIRVHLRLNVQAYNYLSENYHKALSDIRPSSDPDFWDFESDINADFYGLTNFILANSKHVEIVYPTDLKKVVKEKALALIEKISA